jgi:hypothetical protein
MQFNPQKTSRWQHMHWLRQETKGYRQIHQTEHGNNAMC